MLEGAFGLDARRSHSMPGCGRIRPMTPGADRTGRPRAAQLAVEAGVGDAAAGRSCAVSVIVPTYREAANAAELIDRLFAALDRRAAPKSNTSGRDPDSSGGPPGLVASANQGIVPAADQAATVSSPRTAEGGCATFADAELILVDDDSRDGIEQVVARSIHRERIRLLVRRGQRGLASAVLHGLAAARGRWLVVMDADLSHPPEMLPELLAPLADGRAEMVIGSRYTPGGSTEERWGLLRRANSRFATLLARPFTDVSDPMAGFFAIDRTAVERAGPLNPIGYKIGLELLVKCGCRAVAEVPIHFADRRRGRSKLTFAEQLRYVEHLSRLYDYRYPRLAPVLKFLIVTFLGLVGGYLWIAAGRIAGLAAPTRQAAGSITRSWLLGAYWPAVAVNLLAYWRYVKQMMGYVPIRRPKAEFAIISAFEWITYAAAVYWWLDSSRVAVGNGWFLAAWMWFAAAFVTRFVLRKLAGHDIRGLPAATLNRDAQ